MKMKMWIGMIFWGVSQWATAQQSDDLWGKVTDEKGTPLPFVNVYVKGTLYGGSTDDDGCFSFSCQTTGDVTLCVSMLGYDEVVRIGQVRQLQGLVVCLRPSSVALNDVVVVGSQYLLKGNSQWNGLSSVDVVTETSSNGDLSRAIRALPGTQSAADSGELQVRGGDGRETQFYIDDMHVLFPYTATDGRSASRGRYSPFLFEGINFAAGGYSQEYADGLSGVLPLYTKDRSEVTKCGVSASLVGCSGGGTRSFGNGSFSGQVNYCDLDGYHRLFPDRLCWTHPYRRWSGAGQFRYSFAPETTFKTYVNYERTTLGQLTEEGLHFGLRENQLYANSTFKAADVCGWKCFAGGAFSWRDRRYGGVSREGDTYGEREHEIHAKLKASRRLLSDFRFSVGVETFVRSYRNIYRRTDLEEETIEAEGRVAPVLVGGFASLVWHPQSRLFAELSVRGEWQTLDCRPHLAPRIAVNYDWNGIQLSAVAGRYTQIPENRWLLQNPHLHPEVCDQFVLGVHYVRGGRLLRAELYDKMYRRLAWVDEGMVLSAGSGSARGIDLYFKDNCPSVANWDYSIAYSYGMSRRKYGEYAVATVPPYFANHNATLSLRYQLRPLNGIISLTNRCSSGRPFHNPDRPGLFNDRVKPYHSLDLGYTWLISPKVIVYASADNLLCRHPVFGRENGQDIRPASDHSFFVGVFVTLSGKTAYDVSNF